ADVDGHPTNVVAAELALARVQPGPHVKAQGPDPVPDRAGALDCAGGAVEGGEEAVAQRLDLTAAEPIELAARELVVAFDQLSPTPVPCLGGALGRVNDVGEHHRRKHSVEGPGVARSGQEFLHLVENRLEL